MFLVAYRDVIQLNDCKNYCKNTVIIERKKKNEAKRPFLRMYKS